MPTRHPKASIAPYLYYEDVRSAVKWLTKAFGFKITEKPVVQNGKATHAAVALGDAVVMMGWPGPKYKNPKRSRYSAGALYVSVDDADRIFRRAKKAGGTVIEEPHETPYGARRCAFEDPEGHKWYFAHQLKP
jgi:uncharacterized glyoxalase superfamily protein PhnB